MKLPTITAKSFALVCAGVLCLTTSGVLVNSCHNLRPALQNLTATTGNTAAITGNARAFATPDFFRNAYNDWQTSNGAAQIFANTYREVGESLIDLEQRHAGPMLDAVSARFIKFMDAMQARADQNLGILADNQSKLGGFIDEGHHQLAQNGDESKKAIGGLTDVEAKAGQAVASLNDRIKDKRIDAFMDSLQKSGGSVEAITNELAAMTGNFETASEKAPEIAALWTKLLKTSSKWQKYILAARIASLVGPLFGQP